MTIEQAFSENLKRIMEERGIKQHQLMRDTGLGRSTIYGLMNGRNGANLYTAYKIADVLGVLVDELLVGCDE